MSGSELKIKRECGGKLACEASNPAGAAPEPEHDEHNDNNNVFIQSFILLFIHYSTLQYTALHYITIQLSHPVAVA